MPTVPEPSASLEECLALIAKLKEEAQELRAELDESRRKQMEYLQNIAHQLVAPLNAIKWHIENLTKGRVTSPDRMKKVLRSIYSQATIAVHLAKNFALMSNLEADHELDALRDPVEDVDITRLLVNLADDFQPQGWDREINIEVAPNSFANVPASPIIKSLVAQVFSNLIENALKYSDSGTTVVISGDYRRDVDHTRVRIRNKGLPIKPSELDRIFERGFRSETAKRAYPAGTGFGLFIALQIMKIHKGTISAKMLPDGRTEFEVILNNRGVREAEIR